jgi:hypothetical protein
MRVPRLALLLLVAACGSSQDEAPNTEDEGPDATGAATGGAGGKAGAGGSHADAGTGGRASSGGAPGTGGKAGSGGTAGSGGGPGSGGSTGTGGSATGGSSGSGGTHVAGACSALPSAGTWEKISPTGTAKETKSIAIDPFDSAVVWANNDKGLNKSTDCGATWTLVSTGVNGDRLGNNASLWSMAMDFVSRGTIYIVGGYGPTSLWKSTNGGVDWTDLFPDGSAYATYAQYKFANNVSMDPNDHRHLVVATHGGCDAPYGPSCNAETFDGGATWVLTASATGWVEAGGVYTLDAKTWILSAPFGGMWRTSDNGSTWTHTLDGYGGAGEFTILPLAPAADGAYYFPSATQGVLRTADAGKTWTRLMTTGRGVGFAMSATKLFIAEQDAPRFRWASLSDPSMWSDMPTPSDIGADRGAPFLAYDADHHVLYASSWQYGLRRIVVE